MTTKAALVRQGLLGAGTRVGSGGVPFALALLAFMEAGIPIPIPADLVMLFIGERVSAGAFPLWAALVALECVAVVGTTALFLAIRGPGKKLLDRFGPRMGVTRDRLERSRRLLERRGTGVTALGRSTPGLRTVTVVAAAGSGLEVRRALPALLLGSTIFVQGPLPVGLAVGTRRPSGLRTTRRTHARRPRRIRRGGDRLLGQTAGTARGIRGMGRSVLSCVPRNRRAHGAP